MSQMPDDVAKLDQYAIVDVVSPSTALSTEDWELQFWQLKLPCASVPSALVSVHAHAAPNHAWPDAVPGAAAPPRSVLSIGLSRAPLASCVQPLATAVPSTRT